MNPANLVIQPTKIRVYGALNCGDLGSSITVSPSSVDLPANIIDGAGVCRAVIVIGIGLHKSGDVVADRGKHTGDDNANTWHAESQHLGRDRMLMYRSRQGFRCLINEDTQNIPVWAVSAMQ